MATAFSLNKERHFLKRGDVSASFLLSSKTQADATGLAPQGDVGQRT
jgi:hypothetical protein